jgi:hypothetical protein
MSSQLAQEISSLVSKEDYEAAYLLGKESLINQPKNEDILQSLFVLTSKLRSEAMIHASKKANYSSISSYEILLQKVNKLTGEDMYGNFK